MMQERLFKMVHILMNQKRITAKELAQRLEVSMRTIYRDLDALALAGIPVYASKGAGGGIFIDPDYLLQRSIVSDKEQDEILLGLQILHNSNSMDTSASLEKMQALFHPLKHEDMIQIDFDGWGSSPQQQERFTFLRNAIMNHQVIHFSYVGNEQKKTHREVEPYALLLKGSAWYLKAWCRLRNTMRTFKLSRMRDLETVDEFFLEQHKENKKVDNNLNHVLGMNIHLRFKKDMWYRLIDEFEMEEIEEKEDGYYVKVNFPIDAWVYGYLLSYQDGVEVLSPQSLRDELAKQAAAIVMVYQK